MLKEKTVICFGAPMVGFCWDCHWLYAAPALLPGIPQFLFYFCDLPRGLGGGTDGRQTDLRIVGCLSSRMSSVISRCYIADPKSKRSEIDRSIDPLNPNPQ